MVRQTYRQLNLSNLESNWANAYLGIDGIQIGRLIHYLQGEGVGRLAVGAVPRRPGLQCGAHAEDHGNGQQEAVPSRSERIHFVWLKLDRKIYKKQ